MFVNLNDLILYLYDYQQWYLHTENGTYILKSDLPEHPEDRGIYMEISRVDPTEIETAFIPRLASKAMRHKLERMPKGREFSRQFHWAIAHEYENEYAEFRRQALLAKAKTWCEDSGLQYTDKPNWQREPFDPWKKPR